MDIQCCGTPTYVIKMAGKEHEQELSISKEDNILVYTDYDIEVVDISQEDEEGVIIENPPKDYQIVYLHNTVSVSIDNQSDKERKKGKFQKATLKKMNQRKYET